MIAFSESFELINYLVDLFTLQRYRWFSFVPFFRLSARFLLLFSFPYVLPTFLRVNIFRVFLERVLLSSNQLCFSDYIFPIICFSSPAFSSSSFITLSCHSESYIYLGFHFSKGLYRNISIFFFLEREFTSLAPYTVTLHCIIFYLYTYIYMNYFIFLTYTR